jgi:hypothetical protein
MAGKKSGLMLLCIRQGHTVGYIITDNNLPYSMLFSMKKRIISTGKFFTSSSIEVKKRRSRREEGLKVRYSPHLIGHFVENSWSSMFFNL